VKTGQIFENRDYESNPRTESFQNIKDLDLQTFLESGFVITIQNKSDMIPDRTFHQRHLRLFLSSSGLTLEEFDLEEEKETESAIPAVTIEDLRARQMRELRELQVCFLMTLSLSLSLSLYLPVPLSLPPSPHLYSSLSPSFSLSSSLSRSLSLISIYQIIKTTCLCLFIYLFISLSTLFACLSLYLTVPLSLSFYPLLINPFIFRNDTRSSSLLFAIL